MAPLRVLHVIPSVSLSDGGPSRAMVLIERALAGAGVEVVTLTSDYDLGGEVSRAPPDTRGITRVYAHLWTRFYKIAPRMAAYSLREVNRFDVVHIHAVFSFSSTIAAWVARLRGVPYVIRPLGVLALWGTQNRRKMLKRLSLKLIEGPNLRAAAAVHFTSDAEKAEAEALGLSFRSVVIPLGVQDEGAPAPVLKARKGRAIVLFLSRLDPKKNIAALIDAFAACQALREAAVLRIAGSGAPAYVESLRARARDAGLFENVEWLGHVDGPLKAAAFADADLYILPSFSENFGIAAVEAMLAGLPCLLSRGVAVAGPAVEAGAARFVEPEPARLAETILELLREPGASREMGARGRAFALSSFSTQAMADKLIALYRKIEDGKTPR